MKKIIHWFRQDLRLSDNPALNAAAEAGAVLPIYILDDSSAKKYQMGAASRWWLHHSLTALNEALKGQFHIYRGDANTIIQNLVDEHSIEAVYWNRCYEPWRIQRDKKIKAALQQQNVQVRSFNGSLLWEPWEVLKKDNTHYKVFTPFYRKGCLNAPAPRKPLKKPAIKYAKGKFNSLALAELALLPQINWDEGFKKHWQPGEARAQKKLKEFIDHGLKDYKEGRNFPAKTNVSRLSPHLHFGEISPNQFWYDAQQMPYPSDKDCLMSELGWREFSYSLLYDFPKLPSHNWQEKFNAFPWNKKNKLLHAWQQGKTGYPIVDAGMRELWQTGYMHNRVRMIVGSFLVKNLMIHWHCGRDWFWDCLLDADLASNSASWQWIAGCGADAAPYFRIFNPITQGEKFDPQGEYTRKYVPEIALLPDKYLYKPWEAPAEILHAAKIELGKHYPKPIVDIPESRERALSAYKLIKTGN